MEQVVGDDVVVPMSLDRSCDDDLANEVPRLMNADAGALVRLNRLLCFRCTRVIVPLLLLMGVRRESNTSVTMTMLDIFSCMFVIIIISVAMVGVCVVGVWWCLPCLFGGADVRTTARQVPTSTLGSLRAGTSSTINHACRRPMIHDCHCHPNPSAMRMKEFEDEFRHISSWSITSLLYNNIAKVSPP